MRVTTDDADPVRGGLSGPTGIDLLDATLGRRLSIGPHTTRPYQDGSRRTCWKCVDCGEYNSKHDLHRFLVTPCRESEEHEWEDEFCPHAEPTETRRLKFNRKGRPWETDIVVGGPFSIRDDVPVNYERVDTDSDVIEIDLDGGGTVKEWCKWPVYRCPECNTYIRGVRVRLASKQKYPEWAFDPVEEEQ